jgi:hypothetical protein
MSDLRTAAQQALEALENTSPLGFNMESDKKFFAAITALRSALAEPVQEPVAWMVYTEDGKSVCVTDHPADFVQWRSLPLYAAPPQRLPLTLTDEVIAELWHKNGGFHHHFARAIERWLKGGA